MFFTLGVYLSKLVALNMNCEEDYLSMFKKMSLILLFMNLISILREERDSIKILGTTLNGQLD